MAVVNGINETLLILSCILWISSHITNNSHSAEKNHYPLFSRAVSHVDLFSFGKEKATLDFMVDTNQTKIVMCMYKERNSTAYCFGRCLCCQNFMAKVIPLYCVLIHLLFLWGYFNSRQVKTILPHLALY